MPIPTSPFKEHNYSSNVRWLETPTTATMLTQLSHPETKQPQFNRLVTTLYKELFLEILNQEWPTITEQTPTRMTEQHPESLLTSTVLDSQQRSVFVDVARAGMLPSQVGFDLFCELLHPDHHRIDHIYAARKANDKGEVIGVDFSGSKIGGDVDNCMVIIPDPMGATGSSMSKTLDLYKKDVPGKALKWVVAHLIITPEYIQKMQENHPDVLIYATRIDRGLSPEHVLNTTAGTHSDQEVGLNDQSYIVPGAGGVGELINNSFV